MAQIIHSLSIPESGRRAHSGCRRREGMPQNLGGVVHEDE
jgi:hypothetical protein